MLRWDDHFNVQYCNTSEKSKAMSLHVTCNTGCNKQFSFMTETPAPAPLARMSAPEPDGMSKHPSMTSFGSPMI